MLGKKKPSKAEGSSDQNMKNLHPDRDFKQLGHLGKEAETFIKSYQTEYSEYFKISERTNGEAHKLLNQLEIEMNGDLQKVICIILYLRTLNSFAAAIKLLKCGMAQESGIVLRSLIETTVFLSKASVDSHWIEKYVALGKLYDLRYMQENYGDRLKVDKSLAAKLMKLEQEVKSENLRQEEKSVDFQVGTLAKALGLGTLYDHGWRWYTTNSAHPSAKSLERFFKSDSQGNLEKILHAPNMDDAVLIFATSCTCVLTGMKALEKAFGSTAGSSTSLEQVLSKFKWKK